ncbi:hypothetical protein M8C21_022440 [Ambrosia artemisiifolia]|uniref:Uncharacterized protein n=1 Tax=Ambrosia artemisiifolia TaxID=4212 RepID=A0AAD5BY61_AMBAR|nr:hypothetical protein M8C21_022440 [Ambrosia artemisiifolia]
MRFHFDHNICLLFTFCTLQKNSHICTIFSHTLSL